MARRSTGPPPDEMPAGVPVFVQALRDISQAKRPLSAKERRDLHDAGADAAERGVPLRELIKEHLGVMGRTWATLPGVDAAANTDALKRIAEAVFQAAEDAVGELTKGYEENQRWTIRRAESLRREFIDDLLTGRDLGQLAERAERYGLQLAGTNVVAAASASRPFLESGAATTSVQAAMSLRFSSRHVLVAAREGLLVCVVPHDLGGAPEEFARQVGEVVGRNTVWRVGLGQPQSGPGGAVRSFEQARNALDMAERLNLDERLVKAADLLVYQVLLRDSAALGELVTAVLEPLRGARGGAQRLVDTLDSYFASGRVTTTTAQALGIGVRTVTYRLDRVRELTGYRADDPAQAFTLQVAVLGARLLGWPRAGPWA
ncbi:CdaR family transcriptional regulator [Lentzea atacamensis]|uniref:CdaR family transcriptional regulator n=1 Tax=Lentzea atacamensis TaxID=531938 RepID=A0ABX9EB16_9PSEU|nr:helix-turn-helix domain-containing protein [Lentzea atacamensis]RAS67345.1 CdaR family transcriptional regulator [Lentzea atacamensis]